MADQKNNKQVTAIIPAYNEAERIGPILQILTTYHGFEEIIVVNDGSTDNTKTVVKQWPVILLETPANLGKAKAMDLAVKHSHGQIIFFCDADITGLTHEMLDQIIRPVLTEEVDMFIAMRDRKNFIFNLLIPLVPLLGGERALTKELWQKIPPFFKEKFRIETALNFYAKYYGHGLNMKIFSKLRQTVKEKKFGLKEGLKRRLLMSWDVSIAILKLQFLHLPKNISTIRRLLGSMLPSLVLVLLSLVLIMMVEIGPLKFIFNIFAEELKQDPNAPFVHFLIYIFSQVSRRALLYTAYLTITGNIIMIIILTNILLFRLDNENKTLLEVFAKTKNNKKTKT